jgi:hypothetical protein
MSSPIRHRKSKRSRKKMLHFAKNLREELENMDRKLRRLLEEHVRYARGRTYRLVNRLRAKR